MWASDNPGLVRLRSFWGRFKLSKFICVSDACQLATPAWFISCHVYNSMKWALGCIIDGFFESRRAHRCERGREAGSVGMKDIGDPSCQPSLPLFQFKHVVLLSSFLSSWKYFRAACLKLGPCALFKVCPPLHLVFILSFSITFIPTCLPVFLFRANISKYSFPHAAHRTLLHPPSLPSPHDCTQFSSGSSRCLAACVHESSACVRAKVKTGLAYF